MNTKIYKSSKTKGILLLAGCFMFTLLGIYLPMESNMISIISIVFFGIGALYFLITLLPGASQLIVDNKGLTYTILFKKIFIPWNHIKEFKIQKMGLNNVIAIAYQPVESKSPIKGHIPIQFKENKTKIIEELDNKLKKIKFFDEKIAD